MSDRASLGAVRVSHDQIDLDRILFVISCKNFEYFVNRLDKPAQVNLGLMRLHSIELPWVCQGSPEVVEKSSE